MFKFIKQLITLCIIIAIFWAGKNYLAKFAIEKGVNSSIGLNLKLKKCVVEIKETSFQLKGIQLENPVGFSDKYMFEAPEIYVNYTIMPIFKKLIHLEEIRFDLDTLIIVKNEKGQLNLASLIPERSSQDNNTDKTGPQPEPTQQPKKKGKPFDIKVDKALLKINKIIYKDYSKDGEPKVKEFNIGIYETFENVEGYEELTTMIIQRILLKTALSNVADVDISGFQEVLKNIDFKSIADKFKFLSK